MARKTPPALISIVVLLALSAALSSCGGGSTAGPVAQTSVPATTAPPAETRSTPAPNPTATAPSTSASAPPPSSPAAQSSAARRRSSGGAAAPAQDDAAGSLADAPAAAADDPPPAPAEPPERPAATAIDERAQLVLTRRVTNTHYFQQGTVTGTYDGTMATEARITSKGVLVRFTATLPGGTISGRAVAVAILDSVTWPGLRGRAIVTAGTGRFAGIAGRGLKLSGRSKPDASRTRVRLVGTVRLP
ncbi:MAG TPA: hypothetical protein VF250_08410 [Conexibacter sp.]